MRELAVADVMTSDVATAGPDTGFRDIAVLLVKRRIGTRERGRWCSAGHRVTDRPTTAEMTGKRKDW